MFDNFAISKNVLIGAGVVVLIGWLGWNTVSTRKLRKRVSKLETNSVYMGDDWGK
jgi:hypothetical protein